MTEAAKEVQREIERGAEKRSEREDESTPGKEQMLKERK